MAKTVEQKLYEALRENRGVRLTAAEVYDLVAPDDAIGSRITNVACAEAGVDAFGTDAVNRRAAPTWAAFVREMREGGTP